MKNQNSIEVFRTAPVSQAVFKNALPAMSAMLMVLVYNLADTFFIGQTNDALQVAAVSLATPVFLIFMAVGTILGVGGTSVISRSLGKGNRNYAKNVCSFCMWSCIIVGIAMSALFLAFRNPILSLIGVSPETWDLSKTYLTIVVYSGPFVLISNCYANIIRAEGASGKAMMGQLLGNLLNVVLDPIMILGFGWDITGAAIATVIGNLFAAGYYICYFLRKKSSLSISLKDFTVQDKVCSSVLAIGIPAALGSLLMSISQIITNSQMAHLLVPVLHMHWSANSKRLSNRSSFAFTTGIFVGCTSLIAGSSSPYTRNVLPLKFSASTLILTKKQAQRPIIRTLCIF